MEYSLHKVDPKTREQFDSILIQINEIAPKLGLYSDRKESVRSNLSQLKDILSHLIKEIIKSSCFF